MMEDARLKCIVEGLLLAAAKPLSIDQMAALFEEEERPGNEQFRRVLEEIGQGCEGHGYELRQVASGYRFQVRQEVGEWVGRLWDEKPQRYSRALLETLAIIAYRQPLTRGDIEKIRGVAVSTTIMRTLQDREWVRVVGHRDVPGRPAMYATTRQFLDYFNLQNLDQLPALAEIRDLAEVNTALSLEDERPATRVLELPDEETSNDEDALLSEEELARVAWATRPLKDIINAGEDEETEDSGVGADDDASSSSPAS